MSITRAHALSAATNNQRGRRMRSGLVSVFLLFRATRFALSRPFFCAFAPLHLHFRARISAFSRPWNCFFAPRVNSSFLSFRATIASTFCAFFAPKCRFSRRVLAATFAHLPIFAL